MISSLDTYVYNEVKSKLDYILKNEHIVNLSLANLDDEAVKNFKNTYVGPNPKKEIDVSYQFPQTKQQVEARVVVHMGASQVQDEGLGNIVGSYDFRETGANREESVVSVYDGQHLAIKVSEPIGSVESIPELSFSVQDNPQPKGNYLLFNREGNEDLVNPEEPTYVTVYYTGTDGRNDERAFGTKIGYIMKEQVELTPLSHNMDTLRCLDALLKVVLITMRENREEKDMYLLQAHSAGEVQQALPEGTGLDMLIFIRPYTLQYTVTNSLDYDSSRLIKEINLNYRGGTDHG